MIGEEKEPTWTVEHPTKPGYYWIRNYVRRWTESTAHPGPHKVEVGRSGGKLYFRLIGESAIWPLDYIVSAEWLGPVGKANNEPPPDEFPSEL